MSLTSFPYPLINVIKVTTSLWNGRVKGRIIGLVLGFPTDRQNRNITVAQDILAEVVETMSCVGRLLSVEAAEVIRRMNEPS